MHNLQLFLARNFSSAIIILCNIHVLFNGKNIKLSENYRKESYLQKYHGDDQDMGD